MFYQTVTIAMPRKKRAKKITRKEFSAEDKQEALRLLTEEKLTLKQTAEKVGCSVASLSQWKNLAKSLDSGEPVVAVKKPKVKRRAVKKPKAVKPPQEQLVSETQTKEPAIPLNDIVRSFWSQHNRAVTVLSLPKGVGPDIARQINDAIEFTYDQLCK